MKAIWFDRKILSNHSTLCFYLKANRISPKIMSNHFSNAWNDSKLLHNTEELVQNWILDNFGWPKNDILTTIWPRNHKFAISKTSDMLEWANWCFLNVPNCTLIDQKLKFWPIFEANFGQKAKFDQFWPKFFPIWRKIG